MALTDALAIRLSPAVAGSSPNTSPQNHASPSIIAAIAQFNLFTIYPCSQNKGWAYGPSLGYPIARNKFERHISPPLTLDCTVAHRDAVGVVNAIQHVLGTTTRVRLDLRDDIWGRVIEDG